MSHEVLPWIWTPRYCIQVHLDLFRLSLFFIGFLQEPWNKDFQIIGVGETKHRNKTIIFFLSLPKNSLP